MAYLDSHGLQTLWSKIKSHFGKTLDIEKSATAVDIKLKNAASTPDVLSNITLPAAGTNNQAGVMTAAQASKLAGIASGAEVNVQPNWDETDTASDAYIRNKPEIPEGAVVYHNLGPNTDGAIDQKVVTDELNAKALKTTTVNGKALSSNVTIGGADITTGGSSKWKTSTVAGAFEGVATDLGGKEDTSNKVSSWSSTTTNTHYPSEKLVKDSLDAKVPTTRKVNGKALSSDVTLSGEDINLHSGGSTTIAATFDELREASLRYDSDDTQSLTAIYGDRDQQVTVSKSTHTHSINGNQLGNTNKTSADLGLQGENVQLTVKATFDSETDDGMTAYYVINAVEGNLQKALLNSPNVTLDVNIRYAENEPYEHNFYAPGVIVTVDGLSRYIIECNKLNQIVDDPSGALVSDIFLRLTSDGNLSQGSYFTQKALTSVVVDYSIASSSYNAIANAAVAEALDDKVPTSRKVADKDLTQDIRLVADDIYMAESGTATVDDYLSSLSEGKVDKVSGKGLSTNDYTTTEKNKLAGIEANANNYVHPTTSGNKHVPSGGSSGKILGWSADGTAAWIDAPDTGVTKITAGSNVTISPTGGTGNVTINATDTVYTHPTYTTHSQGLYKVAVDNIGSVSSATAVTKSDITNLGIPAQDTTYVFNTAYNASTNKAATMSDINAAVVGNAKYRGTLASESALTSLTNYKQGNYWVVSTGWTSSAMGITLDAGNMIFANADGSTFAKTKFDVIQADIEAIPDSEINALS